MKKIILFIIAMLAMAFTAQSQSTKRPWIIGVSTNYVDFYAIDQPVVDQLTDADWMGKTTPGMLRIGRNINKSFNTSAIFATVQTEPDKMNIVPLEKTINTDKFYKLGVQLEYKLANDYLINETSWFDPYLYLGMNGSAIDEITYLSSSMGAGLNIWFIPALGVNFQGSYDYNYDFNDYMHYSIGVVYRIGKNDDHDGDGVSDKNDECPEIAGLEEFRGCPDTDDDGIADQDDECPRAPGPIALAGCPDTDADGVADKNDECPNEAGLAALHGCPDSDGDGIMDKRDQCPEVAGLSEFDGCPDSDEDGVPDNIDKCPQEIGAKTNSGCPEAIDEIAPLIFNADEIQFKSSSAELTEISKRKLNGILNIMNEFPQSRFTIHGYTDNTASPAFNLQLSIERAKSVKKYLVNKGIQANRLETDGFGQQNPVAPNDTEDGRAKNRRVEIRMIK